MIVGGNRNLMRQAMYVPTGEARERSHQRRVEAAEQALEAKELELRQAKLERDLWIARHDRYLIFAKPFLYVAVGVAALLWAWGTLFTPTADGWVHNALTGTWCLPGDCVASGRPQ